MTVPDPRTATPTRARRHAAGLPSHGDLARRVRAAREAAGLTQREAAAILRVSPQAYQQREGSTSLPYPMLLELIVLLGYDPAILCPEIRGDRH